MLAAHCRNHGGNTESCVLSFQDGRVSGEGEESRIEGAYDPGTGQVTIRIAWENESVDYWSGVAVEGAILGWWRDVVPSALAKESCMGVFRMWPEAPGS